MSTPRIFQQKRGPTRWNAFLRQELQVVNDALPEGEPKYNIGDTVIVNQILERWNAMSEVERAAATEDKRKEMVNDREVKETSPKSASVALLADIRQTLGVIEKELSDLHQRTGLEATLFAVRSNVKASQKPHTFCTSDLAASFWDHTFATPIGDVATLMEARCLSATKIAKVEAEPPKTQGNVMQELKHKTSALILKKLREISGGKLSRMNYQSFDTAITAKYGIIIDNWPLAVFRAPSDYYARGDLETLWAAWQSGQTRFRQISSDELKQWKASRKQHIQQSEEPSISTTGGLESFQSPTPDIQIAHSSQMVLSPPVTPAAVSPVSPRSIALPTHSALPTPAASHSPQTQVLPFWDMPPTSPDHSLHPTPSSSYATPIMFAPSVHPHMPQELPHVAVTGPASSYPASTTDAFPAVKSALVSNTGDNPTSAKKRQADEEAIDSSVTVDPLSGSRSASKKRKTRIDRGTKRGPNKRTQSKLDNSSGSDDTGPLPSSAAFSSTVVAPPQAIMAVSSQSSAPQMPQVQVVKLPIGFIPSSTPSPHQHGIGNVAPMSIDPAYLTNQPPNYKYSFRVNLS